MDLFQLQVIVTRSSESKGMWGVLKFAARKCQCAKLSFFSTELRNQGTRCWPRPWINYFCIWSICAPPPLPPFPSSSAQISMEKIAKTVIESFEFVRIYTQSRGEKAFNAALQGGSLSSIGNGGSPAQGWGRPCLHRYTLCSWKTEEEFAERLWAIWRVSTEWAAKMRVPKLLRVAIESYLLS